VNLFAMIDQSGKAMQAERMRAEVVAANMANAETTRTQNGTPYHRQHVVFATDSGSQSFVGQFSGQFGDTQPAGLQASGSGLSAAFGSGLMAGNLAPGVRIAGVVEDKAPALRRYDPSHPDADVEGYVSYPDINPLTEMVDLMGATRAYGLNASAVQAEKSMINSALEIAK